MVCLKRYYWKCLNGKYRLVIFCVISVGVIIDVVLFNLLLIT